MFGSGVKSVKSTGTRCIDHKLRAMKKLVDKFGLYAMHLQNVIADTSKQCGRDTLQGKLTKMLDSVLLCSAFFIDVLSEAKKFSLITQKSESNIINIVDSADSTKGKYERLVNKIRQNNDYIFQLPTLKSVVEEIENVEDSEPRYQNRKILHEREKVPTRPRIVLKNALHVYTPMILMVKLMMCLPKVTLLF